MSIRIQQNGQLPNSPILSQRRVALAQACRSVKTEPIDALSYLDWPAHDGQMRAWNSTARVLLILTGSQAGKTTFLPAMLYREIQRRGFGDYLAASSTFPTFDTKFLPALKDYFCRKVKWGKYKAGRGGAGVIEGFDGSRILCRMGTDPDALESGTFKGAILDEWGQDKIPVESWEAVKRRLAKEKGRAIFGTTPYSLGWLKQQVYDRWIGGDPLYEVVNFRSIDNPGYPLEEYERCRRELPDWKFQMFSNGLFTRPAGLIYGDYNDSYRELGGHLARPFRIPDHWLRYVGVDFGGSIHNAQIWIAEDPENHNLFAYREVCGIDNTGPEQARDAAEYKEPVTLALGGAHSEGDKRHEWSLAGFPISEPFIFDVESGIDRVTALFKTKRLYIFDTLTGLRSELGTYSRELDDTGEPLEKIKDKEKFHRLDALRYIATAFNPIVDDIKPSANDYAMNDNDYDDLHPNRAGRFY